MEECYVYAGSPNKDYIGDRIEVPPPPNCLFVIYILPTGDIDGWGWRTKSEEDPLLPENFQGQVIWPKQ